jgi:hypothetical protein
MSSPFNSTITSKQSPNALSVETMFQQIMGAVQQSVCVLSFEHLIHSFLETENKNSMLKLPTSGKSVLS